MRKVYNQRAPRKRAPQKLWKQTNPCLCRKWIWAEQADHRRKKYWNWRMIETIRAQSVSPVPMSLYGWKWDWSKSMSIHGGVK
jgi:hypothetical protein